MSIRKLWAVLPLPEEAAGLDQYEMVAYLLDHGYSVDLMYLAKMVAWTAVKPDSDAWKWQQKVLQMLADRGVKAPLSRNGT